MSTAPLSKEDAERFRQRVEYEDELLNTRLNIVLTLNGLAAVAVGLAIPSAARMIVVALMIVINTLWIPRAFEAARFISALVQRLKASPETAPVDEAFRWTVVRSRRRVGSTKFLAVVIPSLLLAGWLAAAGLAAFATD